MSRKKIRPRWPLQPRQSGAPIREPLPEPRPRLIWAVVLLVGLAVFAGGGWIILKKTQRSGEDAADSLRPIPARASKNGNGTPSGASGRAEGQDRFAVEVNRGADLLAQGKAEEAVTVFTEAMRLKPDDEDVHYNLGLALARLGKLDEAIQQYNEALRLFPDYAEAHNNLGNALMRAGRDEEAITHFERSIKLMPDYASAHNNLGTALQKAGRTNDAAVRFREAVRLNPNYWQAHFNLATSCLQEGRLSEARAEFETVLRLNPEFPPAKAALAELERQQAPGPATKP